MNRRAASVARRGRKHGISNRPYSPGGRRAGWNAGVLTGLVGALLAGLLPASVTAAGALADTATAAATHKSFVIQNVRLFDGARLHDQAAVRVEDGRIVEVEKQVRVRRGWT